VSSVINFLPFSNRNARNLRIVVENFKYYIMPRRASARGRARPLNRILARGNRLNFNAANSQTHVPWIRGSSNDTRSHHSYDMHASGAVKGVNGIRPVSIAIARVPAAQLESDLICASRVHLTMPRCQLTIANAIHPSVPQSNRITLCTVTRHGRCLSLPLSLSLSLSLMPEMSANITQIM